MLVLASLGEVTALIGAVAALLAAAGGFLGIREYRMKSQAQRVEMDVKLSKLLAELVPIANGRGGSTLSETAAAVIARAYAKREPAELAEALKSAAVTSPVGEMTQASAITSLGYLGAEHEALRESAYEALRSFELDPQWKNLLRAKQTALEMIEARRG